MSKSRHAITLAVASGVFALSAAPAAAQRPVPPDRAGVPDRERRANVSDSAEALRVLQGTDTVMFFDAHRISAVARALHTIREQYPEIESIGPGPTEQFLVLDIPGSEVTAALIKAATEATGGRLRTYPGGDSTQYIPVTVCTTGLPALDALNARLGLDSVVVDPLLVASWDSMAVAVMYFSRPTNLPAIRPLYDSLHIAGVFEAPWHSDDGDRIALVPKGRVLHFVLSAAGGDCPNGCTERANYYFSFDTASGRVSWDDSLEQAAFRRDHVHLWDVPSSDFVRPSATLADLLDEVSSNRWWVRLHGVHALGYLLDPRWSPCHGAATAQIGTGPENARALRLAATTHRQEALNLLINRLTDPDVTVAAAADSALESATGHAIPRNTYAQRAWHQWIARMSCEH